MRVLVVAVLALGGCTTPHLGAVTPAGGIVKNYGWQPNKSLHLAQEYCAKMGKSAQVGDTNDLQDIMTFDCV